MGQDTWEEDFSVVLPTDITYSQATKTYTLRSSLRDTHSSLDTDFTIPAGDIHLGHVLSQSENEIIYNAYFHGKVQVIVMMLSIRRLISALTFLTVNFTSLLLHYMRKIVSLAHSATDRYEVHRNVPFFPLWNASPPEH